MSELSLFECLGGADVVNAVVNEFYERALADPLVTAFFNQIDMSHQLASQQAFFTMALGGPNRYRGRSLREAHGEAVEQGLEDRHFDAIVEHFLAAATSQGAVAEDREAIEKLIEMVRAEVLNH